MTEDRMDTELYALRDLIASHIECEKDCKAMPTGCGCALTAARAVLNRPAQPSAGAPKLWQERAPNGSWFVQTEHDGHIFFGADKDSAEQCLRALCRVSAQLQPEPGAEFDQVALDIVNKIETMRTDWPAARRKAHAQVLIIEALRSAAVPSADTSQASRDCGGVTKAWAVLNHDGTPNSRAIWPNEPGPVVKKMHERHGIKVVPVEISALSSTPSGTEPSAPAPESSR